MAVLKVLKFPDPKLRDVAKPVKEITPEVFGFVGDMLETMYAEKGVGLAATQVGVPLRIVVMDVSESRDNPLVLINPEVEIIEQELFVYREGCLSVPSFYEDVSRPKRVRVRALGRMVGEKVDMEAEGLLAVCIQHELDHLDGKLFVDHISALKRNRIKSKMEKMKKKGVKQLT